MTIGFNGISSVSDRTLFTNRGPIVKRPIALLTGSDLRIINPQDVLIPSGSFTPSSVGMKLTISGSANSRNDGSFYVEQVISPTKLRLRSSTFSTLDESRTVSLLISLSNDIRRSYNSHVLSNVHQFSILSQLVTAQVAVDLDSSIILLNQIKQLMNIHVLSLVGVHPVQDPDDVVVVPDADSLGSAIRLANSIRLSFENHRQFRPSHPVPDEVNRITARSIDPVIGTFPNPLTGPLNWTLYNPRDGEIADDPSDVQVFVNSVEVPVEAVFGLLGAVVLEVRPGPTDSVSINYSYISNPPTQIQRLNSPEYALNQQGNRGLSGLPSHKYRARSTLLIPSDPRTVRSSRGPKRVGWKYKGLERLYTASLNDPNTLLLNVPTNRVGYQGIQTVVRETVVKYDPTVLPNKSTDPWIFDGNESDLSLSSGGFELSVAHSGSEFITKNLPPFFSHSIDISYPSIVSAAFRTKVDSYTLDGDFTGVCFGLSDGPKVAIIGFLETDVTNLSSGIVLANSLKSSLGSHVVSIGIHLQPDPIDAIPVVDATDLGSLIILVNSLKFYYNRHLNKGLSDNIHLSIDSGDLITLPDARNLSDAIVMVNLMRLSFNAHIVGPSHVSPDLLNSVNKVKQVGILTNRGYPEFQDSWNTYAADWTQYRTYRIFRNSDGKISLFFSGVSSPISEVTPRDLPSLSSIDGKFDLLQQVFFGTIGKKSSSVSKWAFIRVNINPLDSDQTPINKSVNYDSTVVPELDLVAPWIIVGNGGFERTSLSTKLILDSTASSSVATASSLGKNSGPYRGFIRLEPSLTSRSTCSLEFRTRIGFYTFSVDNLSVGARIEDDQFSVNLSFLQANPTPAQIVGKSVEPFSILSGDSITLSVDLNPIVTIVFTDPESSAVDIANFINSLGVDGLLVSDSSGAILFRTVSSGSSSRISLIGGSALVKLGLVPGTIFGSDSRPEPKISWFGEERPDLDSPVWVPSGSQSSIMLDRTLRIVDSSSTDFLTYGLDDTLITSQVFGPSFDWKMDFRLSSVSYIPGDSLSGLNFCGALVNVDEGPSGKNVEIQMCVDSLGNPFVHVVSFNKIDSSLNSISQFPFIWNDQNPHSFDLFTSKMSDTVIVMSDGVVLGTFPYSSLYSGIFGPSITFGSGSPISSTVDLRTSQSVFDWNSVCIFKDSRISDPSSPSNRYVGLYVGGNPSRLDSYRLCQIDWTNAHTYRIVRDPGSNVSIYVDGSSTPSISVNYDVLSLPPVSTSFLRDFVENRPIISFGSFNSGEINRSYWEFVKYSVGKITQTNGIVPPHQELNQGNSVSSPEHLFTKSKHQHFGFKVYSGGTPSDDFLNDLRVPAYTVLGEGTPPVPMSQDLTSMGGLRKSFLQLDSVSATNIVNQRGFLSDFENDLDNVSSSVVLTESEVISNFIDQVNELYDLFNSHRTRVGINSTSIHIVDDLVNVPSSPIPTDLPSALVRLNDLVSVYNNHIVSTTYHFHADSLNTILIPPAVDLDSGVDLVIDLSSKFDEHQQHGVIHKINDSVNNVAPSTFPSTSWVFSLLGQLSQSFNSHRTQPGVHLFNDNDNVVPGAVTPVTLSQAIILAFGLLNDFSNHVSNFPGSYHSSPDLDNFYQGPNPFNYDDLVQFVDELVLRYLAHISIGNPVHFSPDTTNLISPSVGPILGLLDQMQKYKLSIQNHRTRSIINGSPVIFHKYESQSSARPVFSRYDYSKRVFDFQSIFDELNFLQSDWNSHAVDDSHEVHDVSNVSTVPPAIGLETSFDLLSDVVNKFNDHIGGISWHDEAIGESYDSPIDSVLIHPLNSAISTANELQTKFNSHVLRLRSHADPDTDDLILSPPSSDLASLIVLANDMKDKFNKHAPKDVHVLPDVVNVVVAPDATDLQTAGFLVKSIQVAFNNHRTQTSVHGSSVHVRLDAPDGVLYEDMKFFTRSVGTDGLVSPFSDDNTWSLDGFNATHDNFTEYPGNREPEYPVLVGSKTAPFTIIDGDTLIISIDGTDTVTVLFQSIDTDVSNVVSRINSAPGATSITASDSGDGRIRITDNTNLSSSSIQILGGSASAKLGFTGSQPSKWSLISGNADDVQVQTLTSGPIDYVRINTLSTGNSALYRAPTGLTDVSSMDFDATFSVRVNASSVLDGDTGVLIGISGSSGPGFTIAIGFDLQFGTRYVKLTDLKSGLTLFRRPFDWGDGNFHKYKISRDNTANSIQVSIIS